MFYLLIIISKLTLISDLCIMLFVGVSGQEKMDTPERGVALLGDGHQSRGKRADRFESCASLFSIL